MPLFCVPADAVLLRALARCRGWGFCIRLGALSKNGLGSSVFHGLFVLQSGGLVAAALDDLCLATEQLVKSRSIRLEQLRQPVADSFGIVPSSTCPEKQIS